MNGLCVVAVAKYHIFGLWEMREMVGPSFEWGYVNVAHVIIYLVGTKHLFLTRLSTSFSARFRIRNQSQNRQHKTTIVKYFPCARETPKVSPRHKGNYKYDIDYTRDVDLLL